MNKLQNITRTVSESAYFRYFILFLILLSGVIVGIETYPSLYAEYRNTFLLIDKLIVYIFLLEIIIKILSFGNKPLSYFRDPWNLFDFFIVAVCFIPGTDTHFVTVLRMARILRVFRVISIFPKLQLLVNALLKSIPSMGYVVVLLFLVFYIYAVIGSFLFGKSDPVHFGSLHTSMVTLFKVLTLEGWTDFLNIQMYGTSDPAAEYITKPVSYYSLIYFISFILIGAMIIMNLFIGVIMNSMQESTTELQKLLAEKDSKKNDGSTESILKELEIKIDGLKNDINKLNQSLNRK